MKRKRSGGPRRGGGRRNPRGLFTKLIKDPNAQMSSFFQATRFLAGMDSYESKAELLSHLEDSRNCGLRRIREMLSFIKDETTVQMLLIEFLKHVLTDETSRPMYIQMRNKVLLATFLVPALVTTLVELDVAPKLSKASAEHLCDFLVEVSLANVQARNSPAVNSLARQLASRGDLAKSSVLCNCLLLDEAESRKESNTTPESPMRSTNPTVACWGNNRVPPGGRHDNDHRNFRDISIVPTIAELACDTSPWLPLASGENAILEDKAMRLIDKNFRLLREDAVRSIKANLTEPRQTWKNATIVDLNTGRPGGRGQVSFLVQFVVDGKRTPKWERSRHLMHGSVVALCRGGVPLTMGTISVRDCYTRDMWLNWARRLCRLIPRSWGFG